MTGVLAVGAFAGLAAAGTLARWHSDTRWGAAAVAAVNVVGAFALGLLAGGSGPYATALGTGGLGALTTVSGLADHVAGMWGRSRVAAVAYAAGSAVVGVGAAWAGLALVGA